MHYESVLEIVNDLNITIITSEITFEFLNKGKRIMDLQNQDFSNWIFINVHT